MPLILQKVIAEWRNRVEATFGGLLTRTAATIAAHTLLRVCMAELVQA